MPAFLNPALLAALVGVAVPLAVHLLGRRHGKPVRFAPIRFLLASEKRLRRRRRLVNLLLLGLRVMIVAAAALAVARPILDTFSGAASRGPVSAVAVMDLSLSMRARGAEGARWDHAQRGLLEAIEGLGPGSEVAVLAADRRPRLLTRGFVSAKAARAVVAELAPGHGWAPLDRALEEAEALLETAGLEHRRILLASDLQAAGFEAGFDPPRAELQVVGRGAAASPANRAVVRAAITRSELEQRLEVEVARWGAARQSEVVARLTLQDRLLARRTLGAGADDHVLETSFELPPGLVPGEVLQVSLEGSDALAEDDRWPVVVEASEPLQILAVNGAPAASMHQDEMFYLSAALRSAKQQPRSLSLEVVDGTAGRLPPPGEQQVVILANLEALPPGGGDSLVSFVERGGGLLLSVGERVDPARWNPDLADLLPALLERQIVGPGETALVAADPEDPVLAPLETLLASGGARVRVEQLFALSLLDQSRVLLELEDGRPLMVSKAHGKGRVVLLATSLDRDWTDLPLSPVYLPLMERVVRSLSRALDGEFSSRRMVGEPVRFPRHAAPPLRVSNPAGSVSEPAASGDGSVVYEATELPGVYRASDAEGRRWDFTLTTDPRESDLRTLDAPEALQQPTSSTQTSASLTGRELALWLAMLALAAFALESLLAAKT